MHYLLPLRWRYNGRYGVSNQQLHDCLLKKTSRLRVTGLFEGNSSVTRELPAQRASNAENVSIWWRHHEKSEKIWTGVANLCAHERVNFVCLSLLKFPSSYHHQIFRSYYQWQTWGPCKRSRSKVKVREAINQFSRFRTVNPVLTYGDEMQMMQNAWCDLGEVH